MRTSRSSVVLPIPVRHALRKLGHDIKDARRRRRIPMAIAAQRASISKPTLHQGGAGRSRASRSEATPRSFLSWAWPTGWRDLAAPKNDPVGLQLEEENLPQRIRGARKQKTPEG